MPTLLRAIQIVAEELGNYDQFTASAAAVGADSTRQVVVASRADTELNSAAYHGGWLYATSGNVAGQQGRIALNGFDPTTGTFTTTSVFSTTPASGVVWLYSATMPVIRNQGRSGIREAINQGLAAITYRDEIVMTGVANQYAYALSSLPWLGEFGRIVDVLDPPVFAGANPEPTWRSWNVRYDASAPYLELGAPYNAGDAFRLVVRRGANTFIKAAGVWTDTTAGLVNDTDEADVEEQVLKVFALWKAYSALARQGTPQERAVWEPFRRKYEASATQIKESREGPFGRPLLNLGGVQRVFWDKTFAP